jgi:hypothetical protein
MNCADGLGTYRSWMHLIFFQDDTGVETSGTTRSRPGRDASDSYHPFFGPPHPPSQAWAGLQVELQPQTGKFGVQEDRACR